MDCSPNCLFQLVCIISNNYKEISLLSTPGKVYSKVVLESVQNITNGITGEEQGGFRKGIGMWIRFSI